MTRPAQERTPRPVLLQVVLTLLVAAMMVYSFAAGTRLAGNYAPQQHAVIKIKLEAALAHLWFEELISGDRHEPLDAVWEHLSRAAGYAQAVLDGGEYEGGPYEPLQDPELRLHIEEALIKISSFREIAAQRWSARGASGIGTDIDQRFDAVFHDLLEQADLVDRALEAAIAKDLSRFRAVLVVLTGLSLLLSMIIGMVFRNFRVHRERSISALRRSEERLRLSTDVAGVAVWEYDPIADRLNGSANHNVLYGVDHPGPCPFKVFAEAMHPDDRGRVIDTIHESTAPGGTERNVIEFRIIRPDQSVRWLSVVGEVVERSAAGAAVKVCGCLMDVTESKRAEEALRASEQEARLMADLVMHSNQPVGIGFLDGRMGRANPAFAALTGYTVQELQQLDWAADLTPEKWLPVEYAALERLEQTGGPVRYEKEYIRKDGSVVPIELFAHLARNADGAPDYYYAFITDITERKKTEQALIESEHRYRGLFENMSSGFILFETVEDPPGRVVDLRILAANQQFAAVAGSEVPDLVGRCLTDIMPGIEHDEADWIGRYADIALTGEPRQFEQYSDLLDCFFSVTAYRAAPRQCAVNFVDITEQKREQKKLKLITEALDNSLNAFAILSADGRFTYVNQSYVALWGYDSAEEILATSPAAHCLDPEMPRKIADCLQANGRFKGEFTAKRKDGSTFEVLRAARLTRDAEGHVFYAESSLDISERKRAQQLVLESRDQLEARVEERTTELQQRKEEAEALNRAMINLMEDLKQTNLGLEAAERELRASNKELEAFSYSVSHDLRAPLRHIDGFVGLLLRREEKKLDAKSTDYLHTIAQASIRMGRLIDDLLGLSRTSRTEMHFGVVDMNRIVAESVEDQSALLDRRIEWCIADLPPVQADRSLLRHVWDNLIGNAVKYTGKREAARIEIGTTDEGAAEGEAVFYIRDNGAGFDPQYAEKLFGVFQRLHRDDEFEGTGIGLATVRRIVRRHGGRVWAEGQVDRGAAFFFTLKAANGVK